MTPQEREVIDGIFERLKPAATQPRDPEAEKHIVELLRQQPYATYVLAQSAYVQEQAINNLARENEQMKAQLVEAQKKAEQPAQPSGFLSSIFGGAPAAARPQPAPAAPQGGPWGGSPRMGAQPAGAQPMQAAPQGGPWGGQAAAAPQQGGGSSFLGSALTTVAGVAGGMVVGNMLMNAFKGNSGSNPAAPQASSDFQPMNQSGGEASNANYANEADSNYGNEYDEDEDDGSYDNAGDYGDDGSYEA